ncbi:hypothetical protein [Nocardioides caldifontis]|uniref:hypothetical protein n=1 Tax=Nocardioides caldifontis TaxID=2588938 RepID=UPI0011DF23D0|nr:hypothetical protein [Nocardioides caldifontis]
MDTPTPGQPGADLEAADFHAEWVAALEQLEVDVETAEALLAAGQEVLEPPAPWTPPVMRSPLPSDLQPRARLVLERQLAVAHRLSERLTENGRHRRYTTAVRNNAAVDIPVYVDLRA